MTDCSECSECMLTGHGNCWDRKQEVRVSWLHAEQGVYAAGSVVSRSQGRAGELGQIHGQAPSCGKGPASPGCLVESQSLLQPSLGYLCRYQKDHLHIPQKNMFRKQRIRSPGAKNVGPTPHLLKHSHRGSPPGCSWV